MGAQRLVIGGAKTAPRSEPGGQNTPTSGRFVTAYGLRPGLRSHPQVEHASAAGPVEYRLAAPLVRVAYGSAPATTGFTTPVTPTTPGNTLIGDPGGSLSPRASPWSSSPALRHGCRI